MQISQRYLISSTFLFAIDVCSTGLRIRLLRLRRRPPWIPHIYIFHNSICSANFPETVRRLIFGRCHRHHGSHTQPGQCQASLEWGRWRSSGRRRTMKTENANVVTSDQCTAPRINSSGSLRTHSVCPPVRRTCCWKVLCNSVEVLKSTNHTEAVRPE